MKLPVKNILLVSLLGLFASLASAADLAGKWKADIETPRGVQKYEFTFTATGDQVTGTAHVETAQRTRDTELTDVKVTGDTVTFAEVLNFQGNEFRITYSGKIGAKEIAFHRQMGDFGSADFTATRVE